MGISEFDVAEITFLANDPIELTDPEEKRKFDELCDMLDELQDVQNVYHNVKNQLTYNLLFKSSIQKDVAFFLQKYGTKMNFSSYTLIGGLFYVEEKDL